MRLGRRKTEPGVAGLSTSASCPIAREQPTIKTVTDRGNVVKNLFVGNCVLR